MMLRRGEKNDVLGLPANGGRGEAGGHDDMSPLQGLAVMVHWTQGVALL